MEENGRWERTDVGKIQGDRGVILGFGARELFGGCVCNDVPWLETPVAWLQDTRASEDDIGQAEEETCVIRTHTERERGGERDFRAQPGARRETDLFPRPNGVQRIEFCFLESLGRSYPEPESHGCLISTNLFSSIEMTMGDATARRAQDLWARAT